ncbi:hypothetical protein DFR67_10534 [Williamsia limnetica]|uniref:Uncharacterized protein n=1 Tax=Williamsia limnetica TaxID=882452 RepID=A0A318RLI0_WILLI|nr:hypothetical protein [Williamsia limnetica]PYE17889.1 hypothetical protein DFR67_10534 [Williamsia limnetica]
MPGDAKERRRKIVRLRAKGWTGFLSALATFGGIAFALFFWAGGSALGAVIAVVAAVVFASVTVAVIISNRHETDDPDLDNRMARLRRARYRSAYPRPESARRQDKSS